MSLDKFAAKKRIREFTRKMGIGEILHMSAAELEMNGFTKREAEHISDAVQMVKEAQIEYGNRATVIRTSTEMHQYVMPRCQSRQECFWVLGLSIRQKPVLFKKVAMGDVTGVTLTIKNILSPIITHQLPRMAIIHNHPSGMPDPSDTDLTLTGQVVKAAELMGIEVVDHLIITASDAYTSLADKGYL